MADFKWELGNRFYEKLVYDEYGQMVTASYMDYLFPQASDMPAKMEIKHSVTPSPLNPLGIKGIGEAGAICVPACFMQALEDALYENDLDIVESSLNPEHAIPLRSESEKRLSAFRYFTGKISRIFYWR